MLLLCIVQEAEARTEEEDRMPRPEFGLRPRSTVAVDRRNQLHMRCSVECS
jgi:hypothetical protein